MKKKIVVLISTLILLLILLLLSLIIGSLIHIRITLAVTLITISFLLIYVFGGVGKLVSSMIYGVVLAICLLFFPKYDMALIFIGTFIFALNPLGDLETVVDNRFPEEKSLISYLRGSYNSYYQYRNEIKNYYHLPQMRKAYNKPVYLKLRQVLTIILSMIAVFLLIREVNNLINFLKYFQIHTFFASTYSVIILAFVTIILYRKGFQSMLNLLTISIFPPVAYSLYLMVSPSWVAILLGTIVIVVGIISGVYQYFAFRSRIVYEYYYYYDNDLQAEVYANALFEPFVYDEAYHLTVIYLLRINKSTFDRIFHNLVVYADMYKFYITTYTNNHKEIKLYTEFHHGTEDRISKFAKYIEKLISETINYELIVDQDKVFYEKNFFHKNDYIVARTIYLSSLLKKLDINANIFISITAFFENKDDITNFSNFHSITRLPEFDLDNILTVRIDFKIVNVEYLIEAQMREILLDLLINRGKYVRVSVYY